MDLATIRNLVEVYGKPEKERIAKDSLLLIARMIQILEPGGHGVIGYTLDSLSTEVNSILSGMRSQLEALVGPKIGGLFLAAERELNAQIQLRESRIRILEKGSDPSEVLDQLMETGWVTHLERGEWIGSDFERSQAKQTERWHLGCIQHEMQKLKSLESLFDRFVTNEGSLGAVAE